MLFPRSMPKQSGWACGVNVRDFVSYCREQLFQMWNCFTTCIYGTSRIEHATHVNCATRTRLFEDELVGDDLSDKFNVSHKRPSWLACNRRPRLKTFVSAFFIEKLFSQPLFELSSRFPDLWTQLSIKDVRKSHYPSSRLRNPLRRLQWGTSTSVLLLIIVRSTSSLSWKRVFALQRGEGPQLSSRLRPAQQLWVEAPHLHPFHEEAL